MMEPEEFKQGLVDYCRLIKSIGQNRTGTFTIFPLSMCGFTYCSAEFPEIQIYFFLKTEKVRLIILFNSLVNIGGKHLKQCFSTCGSSPFQGLTILSQGLPKSNQKT